MKIERFIEFFAAEEKCKEHFKVCREKEGVYCKKCGNMEHYWLKSRWQWQCKICEFRTTLRSGTLMQHSNLPFRDWYLAMAFMSFSKKPISAMELQRQLGHKYDSIWYLMHRIRKAMGQTDDIRTTCSKIDFSAFCFQDETSEFNDSEIRTIKPSAEIFDTNTGNASNHNQTKKWYFVMRSKVVGGAEGEYLQAETFLANSGIRTGHSDFRDFFESRIFQNYQLVNSGSAKKWAKITAYNAKRTIFGIFQKIKGRYLQNYLSEFCYKLNRRNSGVPLFDRLSIAMARSSWYDSGESSTRFRLL